MEGYRDIPPSYPWYDTASEPPHLSFGGWLCLTREWPWRLVALSPHNNSNHQKPWFSESVHFGTTFWWGFLLLFPWRKTRNRIMRDQLATAKLTISKCFSWPLPRHLDWGLFNGQMVLLSTYMEVSWHGGTPKSSILIEFSTINHPFWGAPIYGNLHMGKSTDPSQRRNCLHLTAVAAGTSTAIAVLITSCATPSQPCETSKLISRDEFQPFRSCQLLIHNQWNIKHQSPVKHQTSISSETSNIKLHLR
jgi:hypothetical protein